MIRGVVTGKEVLKNAGTIAREFGLPVLFRCFLVVLMHKQTTFLNIVFR